MWLGHLIGEPQCQYLYLVNLMTHSFNEHLALCQALWHVALADILVILVFLGHTPWAGYSYRKAPQSPPCWGLSRKQFSVSVFSISFSLHIHFHNLFPFDTEDSFLQVCRVSLKRDPFQKINLVFRVYVKGCEGEQWGPGISNCFLCNLSGSFVLGLPSRDTFGGSGV